jgi:hypothetical protein
VQLTAIKQIMAKSVGFVPISSKWMNSNKGSWILSASLLELLSAPNQFRYGKPQQLI